LVIFLFKKFNGYIIFIHHIVIYWHLITSRGKGWLKW